jgi:natural product precursor
MKKSQKKLSLNKETVKQLDRSQMDKVQGGFETELCSGAPDTCGPGASCCFGISTCAPA